MLLTKTLIRISNILVKIPKETRRVWALSENRWGHTRSDKK